MEHGACARLAFIDCLFNIEEGRGIAVTSSMAMLSPEYFNRIRTFVQKHCMGKYLELRLVRIFIACLVPVPVPPPCRRGCTWPSQRRSCHHCTCLSRLKNMHAPSRICPLSKENVLSPPHLSAATKEYARPQSRLTSSVPHPKKTYCHHHACLPRPRNMQVPRRG